MGFAIAAAIIGATSSGAGLGLGIAGASRAKRDSRESAEQTRLIAEANIHKIQNFQVDVVEAANEQIDVHFWQAAQFTGEAFARTSAAGLDTAGGSSAAIAAENAALVVRDAAVIRSNALRSVRQLADEAEIARLGGEVRASELLATGDALRLSGIGQATQAGARGLSDVFTFLDER